MLILIVRNFYLLELIALLNLGSHFTRLNLIVGVFRLEAVSLSCKVTFT